MIVLLPVRVNATLVAPSSCSKPWKRVNTRLANINNLNSPTGNCIFLNQIAYSFFLMIEFFFCTFTKVCESYCERYYGWTITATIVGCTWKILRGERERENMLLSIEKTKVYHFINYYFSIIVVGSLYTCAINITFIMWWIIETHWYVTICCTTKKKNTTQLEIFRTNIYL